MHRITYRPAYLQLHRNGQLSEIGRLLWERMGSCDLCPRECRVNRLEGEKGICNAGSKVKVASFQPHFGEERPLVGAGGSGTVFLSHCNLGCVFCQNWDISHRGDGRECETSELASMMIHLQDLGCSNINVVSPTHYAPHVVLALDQAASGGLRLPLVYNTSGYERLDVLELLDGVVDVYLADFKYTDPDRAGTYSGDARDYPLIAQSALLEMNRQVGVARTTEFGLIQRGLMIRHLVMPGDASGSVEAMHWIAGHLPANTFVNIMLQYRPAYRAGLHPEIDRSVSREEYARVVDEAIRCGLTNLDTDL
jgi:putative pyruvate formate lyase activating enzyme